MFKSVNPSLLFAIVIFSTALLTFAIKTIANKKKIQAKVDFRRKNKQLTPLLGGLAIYSTLILSTLITHDQLLLSITIAALPIVIIGVWDDIHELSAKPKFIAQLLATTIFVNVYPEKDLIFHSWGLPVFINYFFCYFWALTLSNAINFIDGLDGLAATFCIIASITIGVISPHNMNTSIVITAAISGFLLFNLPPAKIYLGEVGSSFLGFAMSASTLSVVSDRSFAATSITILFIFSYPLIDLTYCTFRRVLNGQSPFVGDHDHIHHKLRKIGFPIKVILGTIILIAILTNLTAYILSQTQSLPVLVLTAGVVAGSLLILLISFLYTEHKLGTQVSTYGRTLLEKHFSSEEAITVTGLKQGIVIDLLPYYKELQVMGIPVVNSFLEDLSEVVKTIHAKFEVQIISSYSLGISFYTMASDPEKLIQDFDALIKKYKIQKNIKKLPDGVYFYSRQNIGQFVKLTQRTPENVYKQVG